MNSILSKITSAFILLCVCCVNSCGIDNEDNIGSIEIKASQDTVECNIVDWFVTGTFTEKEDSVLYHTATGIPDTSRFVKLVNRGNRLWYNGFYVPKYGQLDLKEVFNISVADTTSVLDRRITYLSSNIQSETERNLFLLVRTEMHTMQYLNGDSLSSLGLTDMEIYPIHLCAGKNTLVVKMRGAGRKYWYEASLYDSVSVAQIYAEEHTGNIIYPIISKDSIQLTDNHCNVTDKSVKLMFHDVLGNEVAVKYISKNTPKEFQLKGFEANKAYICSMVMAGDTVKQPVMTYTLEGLERKYKSLRDSIPDNHPRADEIDQLIYRIWKLNMTTGKMRAERWFPFKYPWVAYQLEHIFVHLDGTYGNDDNEYNFKYITYRSKLDGCLQRYILVTPNKVSFGFQYPLIVVMRPCNENRYHLFFSPQLAHQLVVNDMQAVANKYQTFIIMPEARMMLDEDMMPFADAEMKLALEDVQEHYNIDKDRIYLHANCSGGYRALRFATYNPEIFAAIALYAPVYKRIDAANYSPHSPDTMLKNIKGIPTLIFGDPVDTHSPIGVYADLVNDCKECGVPCELKLRRNSG